MDKNPHLPGTPDEFIEQNLGLAHMVAWKFINKSRKNESIKFDKDDFVSIAYIGLIKAYQRFDPTKFTGTSGEPIKFSTYAMPTIRGEILRQTRDYGHTIRNRIDDTLINVDSLDRFVSDDERVTLGEIVQTASYEIEEQVITNDFLNQISPRLREVYKLRAMDLSQGEAGKIVGVSQVSIGRMELYMFESARLYGQGISLGSRTLYRELRAV